MYREGVSQSTPHDGEPILSVQELVALVSTLQTEVLGLKTQAVEQDTKVDSLQETIVNLTHENELLKRRLFGNKTERSHTSELQLTLGDLLNEEKQLQKQLDAAVADACGEGGGDDKGAEKAKPKPKGRRDLELSGLPQVRVDILDEELEKTGKRIGFEIARELMFRRGGWSVLVKRIAKYEVESTYGKSVVGVPTPQRLFRRGLLHTSAVAHLITHKFSLGTPHYRLEQHLSDQCVAIDRSMMCRYAEEGGSALGATVVHAMWKDALQNAGIISTDATGALIQPEKGDKGQRQACKKGHFFTAVVDADAVLFAYAEKHTQAFVKDLFGNFKGYLQSDASNVYDILDRGPPEDTDEGATLVGCWAHCRRYFFEAAICKYAVGIQGLMRIRALYAADAAFRKIPPAKRKRLRQKHLAPLMVSFFEWVDAARSLATGRNLATKALGYAKNQKEELLRVLEDGRLPLDNTRSERSLRKIVVGRKAWMFYGSDTHAESAAALFSIIASCRLHKLDPEQYLDEIFRVLPFWPKDRHLELAPKNWSATRAKLRTDELESPLAGFTIPSA